MRILMLSWEYPPKIVGGISRVVHDLAQYVAKKGHEVHVVTCWENGTEEDEKDKNIFVHRVQSYEIHPCSFVDWVHHLNFAIIERSIKLIDDTGKFDVIHAHDWIVAFAARTLKHSYDMPLITTMHATEYGRNNGLHNDIQRYISSTEWFLTYESWKVICNSNFMKNELEHVFQLPSDKIKIIPNAVDPNKFKNYIKDMDFRKNYAMDLEKIVFFVGRHVSEKGIFILLDAIPRILSEHSNVKFVIAGKGPQSEYLICRANNMGISHKVYFTGYLTDDQLCKLYKCIDIAVFPSLYEPFGIVALEGMLAGAAIVVSDVGGLSEIVEHGVDGMKSFAGNANSLADCILALLHNPALTESIKQNALIKIKDVYNWDIVGDNTLELYNEIANAKNSDMWGNVFLRKQ